ncbi:MAG TPA: hypothetical protein VJH91_02655, partial [Candidatus Paceibacterota bacterium]
MNPEQEFSNSRLPAPRNYARQAGGAYVPASTRESTRGGPALSDKRVSARTDRTSSKPASGGTRTPQRPREPRPARGPRPTPGR